MSSVRKQEAAKQQHRSLTMASARGLLGMGILALAQAHITQRPSMWHAPNDPSRDTAEDVSIDSPPWKQPRKLATCLTVRALNN